MTKKKKQKIIAISSMIAFSAIVSLIIVFSGILIPKPMFQGDYPYYPEVASTTEAADVIVVGDVVTAKNVENLMVDVTPDMAEKEATPYTISTIRVVEVVKGDVAVGDILTIKQLGDYIRKPESTLHEMNGYLKKNTQTLMFLCAYEASPYSPVNPAQGLIQVEENGTLYSANRYSLFGYQGTEVQNRNVATNDTLQTAIEKIKSCMD